MTTVTTLTGDHPPGTGQRRWPFDHPPIPVTGQAHRIASSSGGPVATPQRPGARTDRKLVFSLQVRPWIHGFGGPDPALNCHVLRR